MVASDVQSSGVMTVPSGIAGSIAAHHHRSESEKFDSERKPPRLCHAYAPYDKHAVVWAPAPARKAAHVGLRPLVHGAAVHGLPPSQNHASHQGPACVRHRKHGSNLILHLASFCSRIVVQIQVADEQAV